LPSELVTKPNLRVSVAVAIYNEESVLPELLARVSAVLDQIRGGPHELMFVNDGSSDASLKLLEEAAGKDNRITVISLSRNFGHQAALSAALDHVTGDATVLMDADLQDAPEMIPTFINLFSEGNDVVYATRASRNASWLLRLCYKVFYRLQAGLSEIQLPLDSGDFGLMSRRVVDEIRGMREQHRYLRGLRSWVGFRQVAVPVHRPERHSGDSKYGLFKLLKLASDGVFAFSLIPLRTATLVGALAITSATLYAVYSAYAKFSLHRVPQGFTALVFLLTFLSGVILFFLGIVGEYVGRIYVEIKSRPLYVIDRVIKMPPPATHFPALHINTHQQ
jgi:glycosyltransferase involved in cell wall biosynthesis